MPPMNDFQFKSGFTLVELLVVISVIGVLSSVVLVNMGGAKQSAMVAQSKTFSASVQQKIGIDIAGAWNFDDGSGTVAVDASGTNNNGMLVNAPAWAAEVNCVSGGCLFFDGANDYVQINDSSSLDEVFGTENFTLEAWVYPQDWVNYRGIINKRQNSYYSASPGGLFSDAAGIRFVMGTGNPAESNIILTYKPSLNQWHHIVAIADKSNMYLYVDGLQRAKTAITLDPPSNDEPLCIGSFYQSTRVFLGYIDAVKIYSQPLQISRVTESYFAGLDRLLAKGRITNEYYRQRIADFKNNGYARGD